MKVNSSDATKNSASSAVDTQMGAQIAAGGTVDPAAYYPQVQMVLEPDQFRELTSNIKRLNAGQQSVDETLENVREIFGEHHPLLFAQFQKLIQQETQHGQQQQQQQLQPMQQQHQQARLVQQKPLTPEPQTPIMASNSTLFKPHTSPDGGSGDSIPLAQEARKLDALEKVNETRKRHQKKENKRETKIATHASTLSSALAKVKDDATSEKSIEMPDRKSQPSKCGICKETFESRNALFKHLDDSHEVIREWKQRPEVAEEKISPRACNALHTNQRPAADTWQIQPKGRSSSVKSKPSNARASKTIIQPHVNIFASLYEPDEDQDDDQISDIDDLCRHLQEEEELEFALEAAIAPPPPRYICPEAAPMRFVGTAVRHSDTIQRISPNHNIWI